MQLCQNVFNRWETERLKIDSRWINILRPFRSIKHVPLWVFYYDQNGHLVKKILAKVAPMFTNFWAVKKVIFMQLLLWLLFGQVLAKNCTTFYTKIWSRCLWVKEKERFDRNKGLWVLSTCVGTREHRMRQRESQREIA